jgi:hypothetical protein
LATENDELATENDSMEGGRGGERKWEWGWTVRGRGSGGKRMYVVVMIGGRLWGGLSLGGGGVCVHVRVVGA